MPEPLSPYALGATLYMPATRVDLMDILLGHKIPDLKSVVLCLEDALAERDVEQGLSSLRSVVGSLARLDGRASRPLIFIRPRSRDMARRIADWPGIDHIDGFVVPKFRTEHTIGWFEVVEGTRLCLMPTLETSEWFDPAAIRDLRDVLLAREDRKRVLALRVGGNDLLACLGQRRARGMTLYEGPLSSLVSSLIGFLAPAGFALTSPVFEILDDTRVFGEELRRDVAHGFVGKTAIHPTQIPLIHAALSVDLAELDSARSILDGEAPAVFLRNGAMCEPATHRSWAAAIMLRARHFGVGRASGEIGIKAA